MKRCAPPISSLVRVGPLIKELADPINFALLRKFD
jgi:hypothetical protein